MNNTPDEKPDADSVRVSLSDAWREHQHARDQTWTALKLTVALVAGFVAVEVRFHNHIATSFGAFLVIAQAAGGLLIAKHHRTYQIQKFRHIRNFQQFLGLERADLISDAEDPKPIRWRDLFHVKRHNTVLFIMRMHLGVIAFALLFTAASFFL
jgi:hypothetical protein